MIRFLLIVVLALVLGASGAYYVKGDAGYVQIGWHGWLVQTSLLGFVLGAIAGAFALYYGTRLLIAGLRLPAVVRGAIDERRSRRAQASFELGLRHWIEGRWRKAEIELVRRAADHPARGLNYLFAAQAARNLGANDRAERYLQQADESMPLATALARAHQSTAIGEIPAARQLLLPQLEKDPSHEQLIEELAEVHTRAGDWDALDLLLAAGSTSKALSPEQRTQWQQRLGLGRIAAAVSAGRVDQLKKAWDSIPASVRATSELRRRYVAGLAKLNAEAEAAAQIEAGLRADWDPELARLYGELSGIDAVSQLAQAEHWLQHFGEKPELLALAARACRRNKLPGKARSYLEGLLRVAPSASAYLELAQVCQDLKATDDAARYYRQGLEFAAAHLP